VEKLLPEWVRSQASTQKQRSAPEQTRYTELLQQLSSCAIKFGAVSSGTSGDNTKNTRTENQDPGAASADDVGRTLLVAKDAAFVERVLPSDDQLRAWFVCPGSTHPMIAAIGSLRQHFARDFTRATTTRRVFTSMTEAATRKYASGAAITFPGNRCRLGAEAIQSRYILAYKAQRQGESDGSGTWTLETWSVQGRVYLAALGITGAGADECIRVVDRVASLVDKDAPLARDKASVSYRDAVLVCEVGRTRKSKQQGPLTGKQRQCVIAAKTEAAMNKCFSDGKGGFSNPLTGISAVRAAAR
jgi:hypothetical protein